MDVSEELANFVVIVCVVQQSVLDCLVTKQNICCIFETNCTFFFLNNQPNAPIIQIYSVTKLYMFRASSLPIIRSSLLYIRHW